MATSVADRAETRRTPRQVIAVSGLVLAAKITMPRIPGWAVPRPRINELMARGGRCIGNQLYQNVLNDPLRETCAA